MVNRVAGELDKIVGSNLKNYRRLAGLSRVVLGERCGVSYQQISKYEMGTNRISSIQLVRFAQECGVTVVEMLLGVDGGLPPEHSLSRADGRMLADYKVLTPEMQASMRQFIGALAHELSGKFGGTR